MRIIQSIWNVIGIWIDIWKIWDVIPSRDVIPDFPYINPYIPMSVQMSVHLDMFQINSWTDYVIIKFQFDLDLIQFDLDVQMSV